MKKVTLSLALAASAFCLTGCGTTGSSILGSAASGILGGATSSSSSTTSTAASAAGILGNVLGSVLGASSSISQSDLVGTWNYTGADCVFESENLLAKAGGAVAASKIEDQLNTQLAKVGIKKGACSYTFNKDNTYTATIGGKTVSGNYTLDSKNKTIKMTYLLGIGSMTAHVAKSGNTLSLLMESDKLLTVVKGISALGKSSALSTVSSVLGNYDGMMVGMKMSK